MWWSDSGRKNLGYSDVFIHGPISVSYAANDVQNKESSRRLILHAWIEDLFMTNSRTPCKGGIYNNRGFFLCLSSRMELPSLPPRILKRISVIWLMQTAAMRELMHASLSHVCHVCTSARIHMQIQARFLEITVDKPRHWHVNQSRWIHSLLLLAEPRGADRLESAYKWYLQKRQIYVEKSKKTKETGMELTLLPRWTWCGTEHPGSPCQQRRTSSWQERQGREWPNIRRWATSCKACVFRVSSTFENCLCKVLWVRKISRRHVWWQVHGCCIRLESE